MRAKPRPLEVLDGVALDAVAEDEHAPDGWCEAHGGDERGESRDEREGGLPRAGHRQSPSWNLASGGIPGGACGAAPRRARRWPTIRTAWTRPFSMKRLPVWRPAATTPAT